MAVGRKLPLLVESHNPNKYVPAIAKSPPLEIISYLVEFTISVGILTYFAPKTLRHTLETYKITGFIDCIDDLFVIIQKSDRQEEEKRVCEDYNVRYILMAENGNIAWGFKAIYENARNDIILFLENDFIIEKQDNHLHLLNIISPGWTSAMAIADDINL